MADITLRSYVKEIDNLIEQENLDEAIAHARHVLQRYPKYIECYRLLGKAYLEAKRYGDAADIFQRVLSAVPDDFVSHIGMSIVREDEGNLDSSIWHMERAFETNPANPAIQQELKRLIGRREGFEPHKVRLTRGALARMYAHGELYPQAIAELRSALQEDPERPDLQVLLAEMYWQTDQRMEAAEVSGQVLEKLPYCLQSVRIMAAVLQARGKEEEAAAYHRRLAQLNPYMAYIESPMAEPTRVEADTIRLERLSWQPGQPLPASGAEDTEWAAALGLDVEGDTAETDTSGPLPSWLDDVEPEPAEEAPRSQMSPEEESTEFSAPEEEPEGEIPEWMQEAGWEESSGEAEERPVSFSSEELDALERGELPQGGAPPEEESEIPPSGDEEELAPAEIPSWLQGMAPEDESEIDDEPESEEDQELVSWLTGEGDELEEQEFDIEEGPEPELPEPELPEAELGPQEAESEPDEEAADVPGWLDEGEPGATSTIMGWLGDREEGAEGDEAPAVSSEEPTLEQSSPEPQEEAEEEVPSWLSGIADAASAPSSREKEELAQFRQQAETDASEEMEAPEPGSDQGEVPDWLQGMAGEEDAGEPATESAAEPPAADSTAPEEPTSWEAEVEAAEQETVPQPSGEDEEEEPPSWLRSFGDEPAESPEEPEPPAPETAATEASAELETGAEDWLADLGSEPGAEEFDEEAAAWLSQLNEEEEETAAPSTEAEDIPDWMQGIDEEEAAEGEVEDLASTWLAGLSDTLAETPAEPEDELEEQAPDDWLEEIPEEPEPVTEEPSTELPAAAEEEEEEDLEWLHSLEGLAETEGPSEMESPTPSAAEAEAAESAADLEDLDEEGIFGWLDEMAARQDEAEQEIEQMPDLEQEAPAQEEVSETAPPESYEEGLDWLEDLADRRGIDADVSRGKETPEPEQPAAPTAEQPAPHPEQAETPPSEPAEPEQETEATSIWQEQPSSQAGEPAISKPDEPQEAEELETPPAPPTGEREPEPPVQPPAEEIPAPRAEEPLEEAPGPATEDQPPEDVPEWLAEHGEGVALGDEEEPAAPIRDTEAESEEPAAGAGEPWQPEPPEQEPAPPKPAETAPPPEPTEVEAPPEAGPSEVAEPTAPEPTPPPEETVAAAPETAPEPSQGDELGAARRALADGDIQSAAAQYAELVEARTSLEQVVEDLKSALDDGADSRLLWQTLGDAYMKLDRTKDAVKAYGRGLEKNEILENAREALATGDTERAAAHYSVLIKKKSSLESVIDDLSHAVEEDGTPVLWQTLGDAYMKAGRIEDSIQAYRNGMDTV